MVRYDVILLASRPHMSPEIDGPMGPYNHLQNQNVGIHLLQAFA